MPPTGERPIPLLFSKSGKTESFLHKQIISVNGKHPRNFVIDPTGHFLLVANRDTDNIVIFSIDPAIRITESNRQRNQASQSGLFEISGCSLTIEGRLTIANIESMMVQA